MGISRRDFIKSMGSNAIKAYMLINLPSACSQGGGGGGGGTEEPEPEEPGDANGSTAPEISNLVLDSSEVELFKKAKVGFGVDGDLTDLIANYRLSDENIEESLSTIYAGNNSVSQKTLSTGSKNGYVELVKEGSQKDIKTFNYNVLNWIQKTDPTIGVGNYVTDVGVESVANVYLNGFQQLTDSFSVKFYYDSSKIDIINLIKSQKLSDLEPNCVLALATDSGENPTGNYIYLDFGDGFNQIYNPSSTDPIFSITFKAKEAISENSASFIPILMYNQSGENPELENMINGYISTDPTDPNMNNSPYQKTMFFTSIDSSKISDTQMLEQKLFEDRIIGNRAKYSKNEKPKEILREFSKMTPELLNNQYAKTDSGIYLRK